MTGVANNCYCKSSNLGWPLGYGGYMDFENLEFYRANFNVVDYWTGGAVVGGFVPTATFVVALFWWRQCRYLWKANEREQPEPPEGVEADTKWLQ